jgi:hypothetical protein
LTAPGRPTTISHALETAVSAAALMLFALSGLAVPAIPADADPSAELPRRVRRIVLHTLGGPFYSRPDMRFVFLPPEETFAKWRRPSFGAHWIVWTDGTLWPRHPAPGEPRAVVPPVDRPADDGWRRRLAREAAPVYSHVQGHNTESLGIELAHSGRSGDPLPEPQVRTLAWLLETLLAMSGGRLRPAAIVGHKDLDREPAWTSDRCASARCAYYADDEGTAFRRRVDPPESVFEALRARGLDVPRGRFEGDAQLLRAEAIPTGERPKRVSP